MPLVQEIKPATELRSEPPPFVASQSGAVEKAPTANEETLIREMFQKAAQSGSDNLNEVVTLPQAPTPAISEQSPAPAPVAEPPPLQASTDKRFLTPQGTVDEDKLKASSEQAQKAVEVKQKTVDELYAEYRANEKKLHELGQQKSDLQKQVAAQPVPVPVPAVSFNPNDPQMVQLHQQILADMQRDPVGASIMLTTALLDKKLEPLMDRFKQEEEVRQDARIREGYAQVAQADPRALQYHQQIVEVLNEEPAFKNTRNPFKSAWNEVKDRLRLGEIPIQAQPSSAAPTLGRGAPPSVSTLSAPVSPQSMQQQVSAVNPYSPEGKAYEEKLRDLTRQLWQ